MSLNEVFIYALIGISATIWILFFYVTINYKKNKEKNVPVKYQRMLFFAILSLYFLVATPFFLIKQGSIKLPLVDIVFPLGVIIASLISLLFSYLRYGYKRLKEKY